MSNTRWDGLVKGIDCPLCAPRPSSSEYLDFVATLSVSSLYLSKNQAYRGACGLIFDPRHAVRPDELSPAEWAAFCNDLHLAQAAVVRAVKPDHINLAALGNTIPHLHWGIVPRFRNDPRWGLPIWGTFPGDIDDVRLNEKDRGVNTASSIGIGYILSRHER